MTYAIIKLSYNIIGESNVEGGICGTSFFIENNTLLTAHHVFNSTSNVPNIGFKYCQYWLVSRDGEIIEIKDVVIQDYPEIDTTVIRFNNDVTNNVLSTDRTLPDIGGKIYNQGFIPNMPKIDASWGKEGLEIRSVDINDSFSDAEGTIREINLTTIKANDVNISNKRLLTTSYPGRVGMSGGPMFNEENEVVGLMSIGLPADTSKKDFLGAIWIDEILSTI